jgi:DNA-binding protein HU-beta
MRVLAVPGVLAWTLRPTDGQPPPVVEKRSNHVNKNELIAAMATKAGVDNETAGSVLAAFQEVVTKSVTAGEAVALTGFLTFERVDKEATTGRNPSTGAEIKIEAKSVPKVKIGAAFKKAVKGG